VGEEADHVLEGRHVGLDQAPGLLQAGAVQQVIVKKGVVGVALAEGDGGVEEVGHVA
jgi:hypothetical protein